MIGQARSTTHPFGRGQTTSMTSRGASKPHRASIEDVAAAACRISSASSP